MVAKPGEDHKIPSSYRPISLLYDLSELFEIVRIILCLILAHNTISVHQFECTVEETMEPSITSTIQAF